MTDADSKIKYETLTKTGLPPAMSQCRGEKLVETINTEVSQRVITSSESAIRWLQGTLYYIQSVRNPSSSGIAVVSPHSIETHCLQLCNRAVQQLQKIGTLRVADGQVFLPLPASHIMSQRLVEYRSMSQIARIPFDATMHQLLKTLSQIEGLQRPARRSEKKALNAAHKALQLYKLEGQPSKVRVQEPWEKSFVLIQVYIEQVEMQCDHALRQEMMSMVEYASRMLTAIEEYSAQGTKHYNVVVQSLKIRRAIAVHLWNGNAGILRQIQGISKTTCYSLHLAGISTFDAVLKSPEEIIEKAAIRPPPFGADLKKACFKILSGRLKVVATIEAASTDGIPDSLICVLERPSTTETSSSDYFNGQSSTVTYSLVAYTDRPNGGIIFKENISSPETFKVPVPPRFGKITLKLVASIVGLDDTVILKGTDTTTPSTLFDTQNDGGSKIASTIIRTAREKIKSQTTRMGSNVQRSQRKQPTMTAWQQAETRQQQRYPHRVQLASTYQTSVTPSPKPPSTNGTATADRNHPVHHRNPRHERGNQPLVAGFALQHGPSAETTQSSERKSASEARGGEMITTSVIQANLSASRRASTGMLAKSPPNNILNCSSMSNKGTKRAVDQGHSGGDSQFSTGVASWKRVKRHQQKQQQRAFVHKAMNPFVQFQHDPNYSDKYLEALSAQSRSPKDRIIPASALAQNRYASHCHALRTLPSLPSFHRGRQSNGGFPEQIVSTQEVLAQKAEEQNMHAVASMNHGSPPWGSSSRGQSLCSGAMQLWGSPNPEHGQNHNVCGDFGGPGRGEYYHGEYGEPLQFGPGNWEYYQHTGPWHYSSTPDCLPPGISVGEPHYGTQDYSASCSNPAHDTGGQGDESAYFY